MLTKIGGYSDLSFISALAIADFGDKAAADKHRPK